MNDGKDWRVELVALAVLLAFLLYVAFAGGAR